MSGYCYEHMRPEVFLEKNQRLFLAIRDQVRAKLRVAGAITMGLAVDAHRQAVRQRDAFQADVNRLGRLEHCPKCLADREVEAMRRDYRSFQNGVQTFIFTTAQTVGCREAVSGALQLAQWEHQFAALFKCIQRQIKGERHDR